MIRQINRFAMSVALAGTAVIATEASAQVKLPPTLTMTAYDTGTAGFNITVAIGKMMKDKYNSDVRVLPAGNDVARLQPVRSGRAIAAGMGAGVYYSQEGVFEFATKEWGPQPVQVTLSTVDCNAGNLGVAKDTGVTKMSDLKGKRIGHVVGAPALNQTALGALAFGGLTAKDVKIVEFSSYGAMWKGMVNNDVDAAFATTITGPAKELETSPRGIVWPPLPHSDKEGWARVQKVIPFYKPHVATCGAGGISKEKPIEMGNYPYPIYTVYGNQPEADVYNFTRAMIDGFDGYKDGRDGHGGEGANQELGGADPQGRREGAEGSRRLERRPGETQQRTVEAAGRACGGVGRVQQEQPAGGADAIHGSLDEGA